MSTATKCNWCLKNAGTETLPDGYIVCAECKPSVEPYYRCTICDGLLPGNLGTFSRNRFQRTECREAVCMKKAAVKRREYCCEKAEPFFCVCARSYKCPEHCPHGVHVGTHD